MFKEQVRPYHISDNPIEINVRGSNLENEKLNYHLFWKRKSGLRTFSLTSQRAKSSPNSYFLSMHWLLQVKAMCFCSPNAIISLIYKSTQTSVGFSGYRKTNFFRLCLDGLVSSSCLLVMSDCFKCCMHDWHSMKCQFQIKLKRSVYTCFAFLLVCGKPLVTLWTNLRVVSSITFGVCAVFGLTVFIFLPSLVFFNLFIRRYIWVFKRFFFWIKYFLASFCSVLLWRHIWHHCVTQFPYFYNYYFFSRELSFFCNMCVKNSRFYRWLNEDRDTQCSFI